MHSVRSVRGGAPDPGVPAHKREAAGHNAAAEHARKLRPSCARQGQPPLLREAPPRHVAHALRACGAGRGTLHRSTACVGVHCTGSPRRYTHLGSVPAPRLLSTDRY